MKKFKKNMKRIGRQIIKNDKASFEKISFLQQAKNM